MDLATRFNPQDVINAWNTHSADKVGEFYAENAELTTTEAPETLRDRDAIKENVRGWMKAFPDVTADVEMSVITDRNAAILCHFSGTNRGELQLSPTQTMPATNKKVEMVVAIFSELDANGKIVKERDVFDLAGYASQLGLPLEQLTGGSPQTQKTTPTRSR